MRPDESFCPSTARTMLLLAGELTPVERQEAERHLEECAQCMTVAADLTTVERAYARAPVAALDERELAALLPRKEAPRRRTIRWSPTRTLVAAAAVVICVAGGIAIGMRIDGGSEPARSPSGQPAAELATQLRSPSAAERANAVSTISRGDGPARLTTELVALLGEEPNPNVRLAMLDALQTAEIGEHERSVLVKLLRTEPAPALRVEVVRLLARGRSPGVDTVLTRIAANDDAAAVRRAASRALSEM